MVNYDSFFTNFNSIVQDNLEEQMRLYYPEIKEECPNCYLDTFGTGSRSVSIYKTGGPYPFDTGMPCPYCDGKGYKAIEQTEDLGARIYTDPKMFIKFGRINVPDGSMMLIFSIDKLPKFLRCKFLVPQTGLENHILERYYLNGQPEVTGFVMNPTKYLSSIWTKSNG